jgi:hypothetical protein
VNVDRSASLSSASEPIFQQFRRDVSTGEKDAQDQDPLGLDRKRNADGAAVADDAQTRHDLDPLRAALWKRPRQWSRMLAMKFQAIAGDARSAMSS